MEITGKVTLDNTEAWKLHTDEIADAYDIRISLPQSPAPEAGYPVIYVLDGNSYFQFVRDVVRLQSRNAPRTFVNDAIIVGIGHPGEQEEVSKRRFYDFTAPSETYVYPDRVKKFKMEEKEHGGAQQFLNFIESELKPEIERRYAIDKEKQTLFGHSLSGLFTLWALFTKPHLFQTYLAISPSIWWNDHEIRTYLEQFLNQSVVEEQRRLLITVGEREGFMVDDAKEVVDRLKENQQTKVACEYYIAPGENHASVVPTVMSRAIRFATNR
ncbi:putative alpha/beta superfamily hydrolase [Virgibacillus halotolerans]|uniref:alpha/beta hydrolase n=1 Tax=Virgibacillus halotolerans TaxID=1071053 RepID=UPI001962151C|nr:alpha/beta hydrolase-fold protein [Virgibacillus halotolerans]MBM7600966.1 putative alpha/beta superfamily hydrolase [Virgibacillus halotolerans]